MLLKKTLMLGAIGLGLTSAAQAEEHLVVLTGFSYFPAITFAQPGDTVNFINESGEEQTVVGKDSGWTIGPLAAEEQGSLTVTEETELAFFAAYTVEPEEGADPAAEPEEGTYENAPIKAEISFDAAPTSG